MIKITLKVRALCFGLIFSLGILKGYGQCPPKPVIGLVGSSSLCQGDSLLLSAPNQVVAGTVGTIAGTGTVGYRDGKGLAAIVTSPAGFSINPSNNYVYVSSGASGAVRILKPDSTVVTLAGGASWGCSD